MLLMNAMYGSILESMLADTTLLAHVTAGDSDVGLVLITEPFTATRGMVLADLTLAEAPTVLPQAVLLMGDPTAEIVIDSSGASGLKMVEPVGGFTWTFNGASVAPISCYGAALVRSAADVPSLLMAVASFSQPVVLSLDGQTLQVSSLLGFLADATFESTIGNINTGNPPVAP